MNVILKRILGKVFGSKVHQDVKLKDDVLPMVANQFYYEFRKYRFIRNDVRFYLSFFSFVAMIVFGVVALINKNSLYIFTMGCFEVVALISFFASQNVADGKLVDKYNKSCNTSFVKVEDVEVDWIKNNLNLCELDFFELSQRLDSILVLHAASTKKSFFRVMADILALPNLLAMMAIILAIIGTGRPDVFKNLSTSLVVDARTWSVLGVLLSVAAVFLVFSFGRVYDAFTRFYYSKFLSHEFNSVTIRELIVVLCRNSRFDCVPRN